jgi:hypothetical protein
MKGSYIRAVKRDRTTIEAKRRNGAGSGQSEHQVELKGSGIIKPEMPEMFDIPFFEEPQFYYGAAVISIPDRADVNPFCQAIIRGWVIDSKGLYLGAWVNYKVSVDEEISASIASGIRTLHFLTFAGLSYKPMAGAKFNDMTPNAVEY